jgi:hypothetical protein
MTLRKPENDLFDLRPEHDIRDRFTPEQARKIGRMHQLYGRTDGRTCGDCASFLRGGGIYSRTAGSYHKCQRFGISGGPGTDWRVRYPACGKFEERA